MVAYQGPFRRSVANTQFRKNSVWYRQKQPWTAPLPYEMETLTVTSGTFYNATNAFRASWYSSPSDAVLKCYEKFVGKLGDPALMAVNWAERRQSYAMIGSAALGILKTAKAVKRHPQNIRQLVSRVKGIPLRKVPKKGANLWLAYHFGWEPLVKDIYNAVNVLQGESPPFRIKVFGSSSSKGRIGSYGLYAIWQDYTYKARVQMCADVRVSNPNLWMANQLGLLNPLSVVWELIPFSFVIDWFVNVGSFLSQLTDTVGLDIKNQVTTICQSMETQAWYGSKVGANIVPSNFGSCKGFEMQRLLELITPSLKLRPLKALSPTRGLTAVSLLVQQLRRLP